MSALVLIALALAGLCALFAALYFVARRYDNYGVVDVAWAYAFGLLALFYAATASGWPVRRALIASLALIPLRHGSSTEAFGLLVLGSPDPTRFAADMGTEFLMRIGEVSSAGLSRLIRG